MLATTMQTMDNSRQNHEFLNGRILIIGLGATGLSCARFLSAQGATNIVVTDSRTHPPGLVELKKELPHIEVFSGGFDAEAFLQADTLVVSPGVSIREPLISEARARGCEVIGDIEIFSRFASAPVVAITGSNGKSTVTMLLTHMAKDAGVNVAMGGNIGTPALELIDEDVEMYVLELSSFQLETTYSLNAAAAVILNVSEDHMDRYASFAEYTTAKTRIYQGSGSLVVNRDDEKVMHTALLVSQGRPVTGFTLHQPQKGDFGISQRRGTGWLSHGDQELLEESALKIKGKHNSANVLAALALGRVMGLPVSSMVETIKSFTGLEHRCQWICSKNGVDWFNDSKATNAGAAVAAINGLEANKIILIAGGQGKGQDFSVLREAVERSCRCVILLGEDAALLEAALGGKIEIVNVVSMEEAVAKAASLAQKGDTVLLSPACASFDMFSGYVERGQVFVNAVKGVCA